MNIISPLKGCLAACAMLAMTATAPAQPLREITIGLASGSMTVAAPRIANELGLFEKHGLSAKFVILDSSSAAIAGLISGSLKFINAGVSDLIIAQSHGQKVVAVANTYGGFATSMVLSKTVADKLGVTSSSPPSVRLKALDGLVIATTSATAIGTVVYNAGAKSVGATMRVTYIAQDSMPAALESGAIQGFSSSAPYWGIPVSKGLAILLFRGPAGEFPAEYTPGVTAQLQTMREYADANPALIKNIQAIFADLATAIDKRPADVKAAVAKLYPGLDASVLDLLFTTESLGWKGNPLTAKEMAHEISIVKATVSLPHEFDAVDPGSLLVQ